MSALQRLYAFTVGPAKGTSEQEIVPDGGIVKTTQGVRDVLAAAYKKVGAANLTAVDFALGPNREHQVRKELMSIAFGATRAPLAAAGRLAARLSSKMDGRSHEGLLLIAVMADGDRRKVSLMVFPRENVIQFGAVTPGEEELTLEVVADAFSTGSRLRKLAEVEGKNLRTQFLSAKVVDFQISADQRKNAEFWVYDFLEAKPKIDATRGTNELANAIQRAFDAANVSQRDAVFGALFKASGGTVPMTSLEQFVKEVPKELKQAFFGTVKQEVRSAVFQVDQALMQTHLSKRVIKGKDGVVLTAPTTTIGESVTFSGRPEQRTVSYKGLVATDHLKR